MKELFPDQTEERVRELQIRQRQTNARLLNLGKNGNRIHYWTNGQGNPEYASGGGFADRVVGNNGLYLVPVLIPGVLDLQEVRLAARMIPAGSGFTVLVGLYKIALPDVVERDPTKRAAEFDVDLVQEASVTYWDSDGVQQSAVDDNASYYRVQAYFERAVPLYPNVFYGIGFRIVGDATGFIAIAGGVSQLTIPGRGPLTANGPLPRSTKVVTDQLNATPSVILLSAQGAYIMP